MVIRSFGTLHCIWQWWPAHGGSKRLKSAQNKFTQSDFTNFSMQVSENSNNFRFHSLHALRIQNLSNRCRYDNDPSISWVFLNSHFWRFFDIWPNCAAQRPALRRHGRRHWGWRGAHWGRGGVSCRRFFPSWAEAGWLAGRVVLHFDFRVTRRHGHLKNYCCDNKWRQGDNSFLVNLETFSPKLSNDEK